MNAVDFYLKHGKDIMIGAEFWHVSRERIQKGEGPNKVTVRAITEHSLVNNPVKQIGLIEGEGRRGYYNPKDCFTSKDEVIEHAAKYYRDLKYLEERRHASMTKRLDAARAAITSL